MGVGRIPNVRQSPNTVNDTLRKNIAVENRDSSERYIERVNEIAHVDEILEELPSATKRGWATTRLSCPVASVRGSPLREHLLNDADVLILDEATSNLDSNLMKEVPEAIGSMDRD